MKIYITTRENAHPLLDELAKKYEPYEIYYNHYEKPCVKDDKFFYSISYTGNIGVVIISEEPIGIDIEDLTRERKHSHILYHTTLAEESIIKTNEDFIYNWTAKEAFCKYVGTSVYVIFREIEYYDNKLTCYFRPTGAFIKHIVTKYGLIAVAQEDENMEYEIVDLIENPQLKVE